jgi:hypothetical protein
MRLRLRILQGMIPALSIVAVPAEAATISLEAVPAGWQPEGYASITASAVIIGAGMYKCRT